MTRKTLAVMAALALATTARAQGGGSGGGGAGGSGGQSGGSGTSGQSGSGAVNTPKGDSANQAAAQQQAPSVTGQEGPGGSSPRPVTQGQGENRRFGNEQPAAPGMTGRLANEPGKGLAGSEVAGRVALVNPSEQEIAIDAGTTTTQVKVAPDAKITIDGKKATLADIPKGAEVRASLDKTGDEPQAKTLEITSKKK